MTMQTPIDILLATLLRLFRDVETGVVVASSDVLLDLPLTDDAVVSWPSTGVAGLAVPTAASLGSNHGVYVVGAPTPTSHAAPSMAVSRFLQKPSMAEMEATGAVRPDGTVLLDTGVRSLMACALSLVAVLDFITASAVPAVCASGRLLHAARRERAAVAGARHRSVSQHVPRRRHGQRGCASGAVQRHDDGHVQRSRTHTRSVPRRDWRPNGRRRAPQCALHPVGRAGVVGAAGRRGASLHSVSMRRCVCPCLCRARVCVGWTYVSLALTCRRGVQMERGRFFHVGTTSEFVELLVHPSSFRDVFHLRSSAATMTLPRDASSASAAAYGGIAGARSAAAPALMYVCAVVVYARACVHVVLFIPC